MCTWSIAANPKGANFPPSVLLFVYLHWLSCPHLFVSRSEGVPTCRALCSWGREASPEEAAHLSPASAGATPGHSLPLAALPASSRPCREGVPGWGRITADPRVAGSRGQLRSQCPSLEASLQSGARLVRAAAPGEGRLTPAARCISAKDAAMAIPALAQADAVSSRR